MDWWYSPCGGFYNNGWRVGSRRLDILILRSPAVFHII
jgi:hypothetical protein